MLLPEWHVEQFEAIDSTQDELRRRLSTGADLHGTVIRAAAQTGGRGQRGRSWSSPPGGSWQSVALRGPVHPAASLFIGIGLAGVLNARLGAGAVVLKWPNDLQLAVSGGKFAGILCEQAAGHLLTGVGVNVGNTPPAGGAVLAGLALSEVHGLVLDGIGAGWQLMQEQPERLVSEFTRLDALRGRHLRQQRGDTVHEGVAAGIDPGGRLRLLTAAGEVAVDSAVSLRPVD